MDKFTQQWRALSSILSLHYFTCLMKSIELGFGSLPCVLTAIKNGGLKCFGSLTVKTVTVFPYQYLVPPRKMQEGSPMVEGSRETVMVIFLKTMLCFSEKDGNSNSTQD